MKTLVIISVLMGAVFTGMCKSPEKNVILRNTDLSLLRKGLNKPVDDSLTEFQKFKDETNQKISDINKKIIDLRKKIKEEKDIDKAKYNWKVDELDRQVNKLKTKMNEYSAKSKMKWREFKKDVNHDIDKLNTAFTDFWNDLKK